MYTRQQASLIRQQFWTRFGQYMKPLPGSSCEPVNWLNYKTGIKDIYFKMDADDKAAMISTELHHPDTDERSFYFEKFRETRNIFSGIMGQDWTWELHHTNTTGKVVSRVVTTLPGVSIFREGDWPAIISFLKPRIMALDEYWDLVKDGIEG